MSSRATRASNILRPYYFQYRNTTYQFGFDKHMIAHILFSHEEMHENRTIIVQDFVRITKPTIDNAWLFQQQHSWLSEEFRLHLLRYIKLPIFF